MILLNKNKSAFVSITTFTLSIFITIGLLTFSYGFYEKAKENSIENTQTTQLLNSITSFRTQILSIQNLKNSTLIYNSKLDSKNIEIDLISNQIDGYLTTKLDLHVNSIPSLVTFCNNYTFYPSAKTTFLNNGTCISKLN